MTQKTTPAAVAHSANVPKRAQEYNRQLQKAEKDADQEVSAAFFYMLTSLQKLKAPASEIAIITQYHTAWYLRKETVNTLRDLAPVKIPI